MSQQDKKNQQFIKMTNEPVGRLLLTLSVPTIMSMLVTTVYNMVDTAFVGQLGTSASAATGVVFGFMAILQAVAFMFGQGGGSLMSRKLGQKEIDEATMLASTSFFLSFVFGLIITVVGFLTMDPLLKILGSTPTIAPYAGTYISYILISAPFFTSSLTMNNLLRYEGLAKLGTTGLMVGAILNIIGDAIFIFGCNMGIAGAGLSTAITQFISFCILVSMFFRGKTQTRLSFRYVSRKLSDTINIMTTGFPSLLRQSLNSVATMILNHCAGIYGDQAVAAMSIVSRISFFPTSIAIGIGQGFQPICGFNYGAKKYDRVRQAYWISTFYSTLILLLVSIPVYLASPTLVSLFRDDPQVIIYGTRALHLMSIGQVFLPLGMMTEMGFQSTGQKALASFSSMLRSGLLFIPSILILSQLRGMNGVQEAQPFSLVATFILAIFLSGHFMRLLRDCQER